jgi:prefoldin subunit 5
MSSYYSEVDPEEFMEFKKQMQEDIEALQNDVESLSTYIQRIYLLLEDNRQIEDSIEMLVPSEDWPYAGEGTHEL